MELRITVQSREVVEAEIFARGNTQKGKLVFHPLQEETIRILQELLMRGNLDRREHLTLLGSHLYSVLFDEKIASFLQERRNEAKKQGQNEKLKLRLVFQEEAGDLANLPWEYLFYPGDENEEGRFLATEVELTLSRFIPLREGSLRPGPDTQPLRVLVVSCIPEGAGFTSKTPELVIEEMEKLKSEMQSAGKSIVVEYLDLPTPDKLEDQIRATKPHVLHFVGFGRVERVTRKGEVALLSDDEKSISWVQAQLFADYIKDKGVRLVSLQLAHRSVKSLEFDPKIYRESFDGIAEPLVKAGIQAVVAMQFPIPDDVAGKFLRIFYEKLAAGETVDAAVQIGRRVMNRFSPKYFDSYEFGTPMLFIYQEDNMVEPVITEVKTHFQEGEKIEPAVVSEPQAPQGEAADSVQELRVQQPVDMAPPKKAPSDLVNVAVQSSQKNGLNDEQNAALGLIYSQLFASPNEMKGILTQAITRLVDPKLQMIVNEMMKELEGGVK